MGEWLTRIVEGAQEARPSADNETAGTRGEATG